MKHDYRPPPPPRDPDIGGPPYRARPIEERWRSVARDLYSVAVSEHGHDEKHSADWPACLPVHIAFNRYRDLADG